MAYLALYRKYRPKGFEGVIGQDPIVRTLVNQIEADRIGHAYLFCGARGTGKTSLAKVFARAINCEHPVHGSPCGTCETCKKLADSACLDILEIDAASNNRVEEIRELRDKVIYPPSDGKYKVYIVDEVHMLSDSAFNALLKTLEEPPSHAVFVLATTEVHKLPATILSRCMRFDFRLVPEELLAAHVASVYDAEGRKYEKNAVTAIARAAEGSVRDALSIADVCMSAGGEVLTYADVLAALGASDRGRIFAMMSDLLAGNTGGMLTAAAELTGLGKSVSLLARDSAAFLRDLLVAKTCPDPQRLLKLPADRAKELADLAATVTESRILRALELFTAAEGELRYSTHPRVVFEAAAIRAAMPEQDASPLALLSRVKKLEEEVAALRAGGANFAAIASAAAPQAAPQEKIAAEQVKPQERIPAAAPAERPTAPVEKPAGQAAPQEKTPAAAPIERPVEKPLYAAGAGTGARVAPERLFGSFVRTLRKKNYIMLWAVCQELKGRAEGDTLVVTASSENDYAVLTKPEHAASIREALDELGGWAFRVERPRGSKTDTFDADAADIARAFGDKIVEIKD